MKDILKRIVAIILGIVILFFGEGMYLGLPDIYADMTMFFVLIILSIGLTFLGAYLFTYGVFHYDFSKEKNNKCHKCGSDILDDDLLCTKCYKKRMFICNIISVFIYLLLSLVTKNLLSLICIGIIRSTSKQVRKERFITERKLYQNIPVNLEELAKHELNNEDTVNKYKKTPNAQRNGNEINFEDFKYYIDIIKFRDIAKRPKSNLISDYPGYYEFVHGNVKSKITSPPKITVIKSKKASNQPVKQNGTTTCNTINNITVSCQTKKQSERFKYKKSWSNFEKYCFDIIKESRSFVDPEIYKPYIKHIVEYNKKNSFDDIYTIDFDRTARMLIYNISVDNLLCSGRYHIGHGSLDLVGREIQRTAIYCVSSSVKKGYISQEEADEILEIMSRNISNFG